MLVSVSNEIMWGTCLNITYYDGQATWAKSLRGTLCATRITMSNLKKIHLELINSPLHMHYTRVNG